MRTLGLLALLLLWTIPAAAQSYTCNTTANTCTAVITYTEPGTCVGGAMLNSTGCPALKDDLVTWTIDGGATSSNIVVPASAPNGGGVRSSGGTTPAFAAPAVPVPACSKKTFSVQVIARNGTSSSAVTASPIVFDRTTEAACVAPMAPTNLTVQ